MHQEISLKAFLKIVRQHGVKPHTNRAMADRFYRIEVKETGKMTAAFDLDPQLISVASLKLLVETETGLGPARQRLVCRGRVLKDGDLLSVYIRNEVSYLS